MRLSGFLGWPISRIENELSGYEYIFYRITEKLNIFGEKREDYRAAIICHFIAASMAKNAPSIDRILKDHFRFRNIDEDDEDNEQIEMLRKRAKPAKQRPK